VSQIRSQQPGDRPAVRALLRAAFGEEHVEALDDALDACAARQPARRWWLDCVGLRD